MASRVPASLKIRVAARTTAGLCSVRQDSDWLLLLGRIAILACSGQARGEPAIIEQVENKLRTVEFVQGLRQVADCGTKPHPKVRTWELLRMSGFEDLPAKAVQVKALKTVLLCVITWFWNLFHKRKLWKLEKAQFRLQEWANCFFHHALMRLQKVEPVGLVPTGNYRWEGARRAPRCAQPARMGARGSRGPRVGAVAGRMLGSLNTQHAIDLNTGLSQVPRAPGSSLNCIAWLHISPWLGFTFHETMVESSASCAGDGLLHRHGRHAPPAPRPMEPSP